MFICCPEKEAKKRISKLSDLQNIVEIIKDNMAIPCSLVCCPACCPNVNTVPEPAKEPPPQPMTPPDIMVCYKIEKVEKKKNGKGSKKNQLKRLKGSKSRELRASILYQGCDCEKRNGLQDDCRRTGCHGSPECLTKPEPICGPSEFSNGKHLGKKCLGSKGKDDGDNGDDDGNGKVTVYYNCYPATIKV